jgi:hypothetical protein
VLQDSAKVALNADTATTAGSADFATSSGTATIASSATSAENAEFSSLAERSNSSVIANTANALTTPFNLILWGEVAGIAEINGTSDVELRANVDFANVTIDLGTDTNGDYVRNVTSTLGLVVSGYGVEGANLNVNMSNTGVSAGTYGGSTAMPTFVVDAQGRIVSASNVSVLTDLNISADTGADTVNTGEVLRFVGNSGISTNVIANTITFTNTGVRNLFGTTNQITTSAANGNVTLSLPTAVTLGNLTVTGNLSVLGNSIITNQVIVSATDPMIRLANNNNASDVVDIGFYGEYNSGTGIRYTGLVRDATDGKYKLFVNNPNEPTNTASFASVSKATLDGNFTGGNVSGLMTAISVADGGTGNTTFAANSILIGNGTNPVQGVTGTEGQTLQIVTGRPAFVTVAGSFPSAAEYILGTANASLSASRVIGVGNGLLVDKTVAGAITIKRAAVTGDVTVAADANSSTIANNVVSNMKQVIMPAKSVKLNPLATANAAQDFAFTGTSKVFGVDQTGNIALMSLGSGLSVVASVFGTTGVSWLVGNVDPTTEGSNNDMYYNYASSFVFGPKAAGVWPAGVNLAGKPGWPYMFGASTGNADPTAGKFRFDSATASSVTIMRIDELDFTNVTRDNFITAMLTNSTLDFVSSSKTGTTNLRLKVKGVPTKVGGAGGYWNVPVLWVAGALPAANELVNILHIPGTNIEYNATTFNLTDSSGNVITDPVMFATLADVPVDGTLANKILLVQKLVNNKGALPVEIWSADGITFSQMSGRAIIARDAPNLKVTAPAATFTGAYTMATAASGASTKITATGAHGLTTAACITAGASYITIKSGSGTGWVPGNYRITAITVDTTGTDITINHPFTVGMGQPSIALAGADFEILRLSVPKLSENSDILASLTYKYQVTGTSAAAKSIALRHVAAGGSIASGHEFYGPADDVATTNNVIRAQNGVINAGATNIQHRFMNSLDLDGWGTASNADTTTTPGTIQTNVITDIVVIVKMGANDFVILKNYTFEAII